MASTTSVTFSDLPLGYTSQTFFGPPPESLSIDEKPVWTEGETIGGVLYSWQDMAKIVDRITVRLQCNDSERERCRDMYYKRLKGPTNTFSYTHTNGKKYTSCRWVGGYKETREPNAWVIDVTLRIENQSFDAPTLSLL